jgi:glycosyltransferase involved in cell wall biosynthesis
VDKKRTLLICYSFPPFPGIGGRRWAKFVKYLSKGDHEFFVIGALNRNAAQSNWTQDVNGKSNVHYYPVKTRFFDFFHNHRSSLRGKISFKLSRLWLQNRYEGNFYDKVLASNELFYQKAKEIIVKEGIKNLVITIAPNRLVDVGVRLKKEFPQLNFMIDVRDPWNICLDDWDHKYLNQKQKDHELKSEMAAADTADKVTSVYQVVIDFYSEKFPHKKTNFTCIPNGFDPDEIRPVPQGSRNGAVKYFVYTGILYDISIRLFEEFLQQIEQVLKDSPKLLSDLEFHFYIPEQDVFKKEVLRRGLEKYVKFFNLVPLTEIQQVISNAYGCMLFLPPQFEFSLSTKFYEYVSYNKKILLFSNPGEVAQIIEQHHLGYVMLPGKMEIPFKKALSDLASGKELLQHTFPLSDYSIESLAKRIDTFLK